MTSVHYEKDSNKIVHLILDKPNSSVNLMDAEYTESMSAAAERLKSDDFIGIILRSAKSTFFAGGDLGILRNVSKENAGEFYNLAETIKSGLRTIETCGKPVVACINGTALGGGWEIALACHHRIALNKGVQLGLPEVTLGLLPGSGGITRMVRLLGLQEAMPYLIQGKQFDAQKGLKAGLIQQLAATEEEMLEKAVAWIKMNPTSSQPWDQKDYRMPGGTPSHPKLAQVLPITPAILKRETKGVLPAPEHILSTMVEGAQVDFDTASRIETRQLVHLASGQITKNIIGTFWFQLNEIKAGVGRPQGIKQRKFSKVGILGAGMMGAGIAYACAIRGIEVVLKDTRIELAEKGKSYSVKLLEQKVSRGRLTEEAKAHTLALIQPTNDVADLQGCDLIIEAVFEDRDLKAEVSREAEAQLDENALFASNTSTLPITSLATATKRQKNFIGIHFFSPVDKMPLVEIITGEKTSEKTLAEAYDFVQQIAKTPIVVKDIRGFFTSRVFCTFTKEGIAMLGEGISPASIENGAFLSGFPVGPLAITDEVTLTLIDKIRKQEIKDLQAEGLPVPEHPANDIIEQMLEMDRAGRSTGGGFYDYPESGRKYLSPQLKDMFYREEAQIPLQDIKDRLLFIQAVETVRCLEEGVLSSVRDANIGSIMGIGYPAWTGGVLQFINQYGVAEFVTRADVLAEKYGDHFTPPKSLIEMAEKGKVFTD